MSGQEPMLMESPVTNRVYVVTRYEPLGDGRFLAVEKHDVTAQFDAIARNRASDDEERGA